MTFAERVHAAREAKGLSRYATDKGAMLASGTTAAVEQGTRPNLTGSNLVALARVLGVTAEWLVTGCAPGTDQAS